MLEVQEEIIGQSETITKLMNGFYEGGGEHKSRISHWISKSQNQQLHNLCTEQTV